MSKKIYCIARFRAKTGKERELFEVLKALEPDTLREDGCLQYIVTRRIENPCAGCSDDFSIVFNEIWADRTAFEAHCNRNAIREFFQTQCLDENGLVEAHDVCVYSDEPEDYDAPVVGAKYE
ncbi:antibiotic biosynthesis monooxygenase [Hydrogenimonas cancrithermarum]|uniref:Antibiotic biosynthesis monooxygenase n=2 Tax=Hydrogenimonas cancrithermarum TaxID=2993563 RepID=A0ABN6WSK0_9BACT|nr:antibiotic biosynthesis monooxygenase [Hydrogenimonas cancrithermarum]